jgi:esterase
MALINATIASKALGMETPLCAVIPFDRINCTKNEGRILYLLHGLSDGADAWQRYTTIENMANANNIAVIMATTHRAFYTDTQYIINYYKYFTEELPQLVECLFGLDFPVGKTFIAGNSMGGYGALKLAVKSGRYHAAAAFSAVTDVTTLRKLGRIPTAEFDSIFGSAVPDSENLFRLYETPGQKPAIYMACGDEDYLLEDNIRFHKHLDSLGVTHTYEQWEGNHNWNFWQQAVGKAIDFFNSLEN